MKKSILVLAMLAAMTGTTNATVRTVSNDLTGGAQFSTVTAAYTAASNTDTLLIEGTNIVYTMPSPWAKQLVVIGIGYNPNKLMPRHTQFGSTTLNSAGNGTKFYGIEFTTTFTLNSAINNYFFNDCLFQAAVSFNTVNQVSNITFTNCIFNAGSGNYDAQGGAATYFNVLFSSCIFNGWIEGNTNTGGSMSVDHCLFLNSSLCISSLRYATISYSIFMNAVTPCNGNTGYLNLIKNISRLNTVYPPVGTFTNTATGNLSNTNPNFTTYTLGQTYLTTHDYHLQAGSPAAAAATGYAFDIGPHGSVTNYSEKGEVLINPIVRSLIINNTSVVPNGTLNVQINATKPTDN